MPAPYALLGAGDVSVVEAGTTSAEDSKAYSAQKPHWKRCIKLIVNSNVFKVLGVLALIIALFGGGTVVMLDLPDDPTNMWLDSVMTAVMVFFVIELVLRSVAENGYCNSFFFWMDVLGTVSMVFEISFMLGNAGKIYKTDSGPNAAVVRTARAARIGARAGRLSKPLRVLSMLFRNQTQDKQEAGYTAKVLGNKLTQVFSSKVAMLTVVLTLGVPVFNLGRYPEDDFSMRSWGYKLEADYARDYHALAKGSGAPGFFEGTARDMSFFYGALDYFPFQLDGYAPEVVVNGQQHTIPVIEIERDVPKRKSNIVMLQVDKCMVPRSGCEKGTKAAVYFDFVIANQYSAGMDMAVVVFIILCMCLESCDLSFSINRMMVAPMEKMLDSAHLMSKQLKQCMDNARGRRVEVADTSDDMADLARRLTLSGDDDDDEDAEDDTMNEIELLQGVFKKVVFLLSIFMDDTNQEQMEQLDVESKGVLQDVVLATTTDIDEGRKSQGALNSLNDPGALEFKKRASSKLLSKASGPMKQMSFRSRDGDSVLPPDLAKATETWEFNMVEANPNQRKKLVQHIMFETPVGENPWLDATVFNAWSDAVVAGYNDNSYTCYAHACDVTMAGYRLMTEVQWTSWLGELEAAVLLLSAQAHDIGHPGITNLFLVETHHELALRYNDKSPLENMHCATLFEICKTETTNVFKQLDASSYKLARTLVIDCILYTDNALHFELVKEVKKIYGTSSDICDAQAKKGQTLEAEYINQVLAPNSSVWLKVLLHLADISNPLNKFPVAEVWAGCVMNEFFKQGDQEKKLGVPVGILNDRDKVSTPSAQHGFMNVLLAPLVFSTIRAFPTLSLIAHNLGENIQKWHKKWLAEAEQRPEDVSKHEEQIKKIVIQVSELKSPIALANRDTTRGGGTNFAGHWTCISTWGLEDFLAASGVSYMKRKAASSAPWPQWEFQQSGDNIVLLNNSALGRLREEYTVDGRPYNTIDGWKQTVQVIASWDKGALIVNKSGPQGKFREVRYIDENGKLQFSLQPLKEGLQNCRWGRVFERSTKK